MAIALDASTPAAVSSSGATTTTAAFTPPNSSVLLACISADANNGSLDETVSASDSSSGTWNQAVLHNGNGGAVSAIFWRLCPTSISNLTVSCTDNKGSVAKRLRVQVWTGTDQTNPIGATATSTTAGVSYTSTVDQSQGVSCGLTANATLTAGGTGNTLDDEVGGFDSGDATFTLIRTALTTPAGSTVTLTIAGTSTIGHHVAVELVPPSAAAVPYNPQRSVQTRDPGETWWLQRDRRDANTVSTAANPLPSPLDVAWQSGGRYWHLYNDVQDRAFYLQQRPYISDPSLLTPAAAVSYCPPRAAIQRDPGEVQWGQRRPTDLTLLGTALLENELLGGGETGKRHFPAVYDDRREVPQQRSYVSDPSLLAMALLEGSLLGGAETAKRNLPATHADRREMPQQRAYISDPSFYPTTTPTDPLTLAWGAGGTYWLIYNTAALDVDRRESPQQRRYISDPGLLASALLENELLGGSETTKRHLPAYADRRESPTQRPRISDPALLLTALLENELLVGDGRHAIWFARPASPIPTRAAPATPATPADPVLLTADLMRRILTPATHGDRRQAGQQPSRRADQSTPRPPTVRATSTSAVTDGRTSTATATARRNSTPAVANRRTSTPEVEG